MGRRGSGPRARRAPRRYGRACGVPAAPAARNGVLALVPGRELGEHAGVELGGVHRGHPARSDRDEGGRSHAAFEVGTLAQHRTGAVLRQPGAVVLDPHHPVQHQVDLAARLALADELRAGVELADPRLGAAVHELHRQGPLQRRLHGGDQGRGVLVTPGGVTAERHAGPVDVVGQAGLVGQLARGIVDPVPREPARARHLVLGVAVGVQGERERCPHQGRLPLHEGWVPHRPGRGQRGPPADRLHEPHPRPAPLWLVLQVRQRHRLEGAAPRAEPDGGGAHQPAAAVAARGDLAGAVHVDPGPQQVREPEPVRRPQPFDVAENRRGWLVVVGESSVEEGPGLPRDRLRRDPRQ